MPDYFSNLIARYRGDVHVADPVIPHLFTGEVVRFGREEEKAGSLLLTYKSPATLNAIFRGDDREDNQAASDVKRGVLNDG